jgi:large subunit ribosomal protein L24e
MRIEKCYFCSCNVYPGHGVEFVRNDCKVFRFCRSKCHRNFKLKRNPRKSKWTKAFRKSHGKEMAVDSTFEFERKRNAPVQYDRELMTKTLKAMKRVQEIKSAREERFYKARMKASGKSAKERGEALKDLKTGIDLIIAPGVQAKEQLSQTVAAKESVAMSDKATEKTTSAKKTPKSIMKTKTSTPAATGRVTRSRAAKMEED